MSKNGGGNCPPGKCTIFGGAITPLGAAAAGFALQCPMCFFLLRLETRYDLNQGGGGGESRLPPPPYHNALQ